MSDTPLIIQPKHYDLQGGSCLTAMVCNHGDFIAIVIDKRDAANLASAITSHDLDNSDDDQALAKLAELIEAVR